MDVAGGLPAGALSTIVHIGASRCVARAYFGTSAERIVLVEGDADTIAEIRHTLPRARPARIDLIQRVVAAETGPVRWIRYSIPRFNGPERADAWLSRYPRLRVLDARQLDGYSLSDLLGQLSLSREPATSNILVLDVPGQEGGILGGAQPGLLGLFDWLAIRADGATHAVAGPSQTERLLSSMHFRACGPLDSGDPWPLFWYRLDRPRYELYLALTRAAAAEALTAHLHDEVDRLATAHEAAIARCRELDAAVQMRTQSEAELRAELQQRQSALDIQRDKVRALETQVERARLDSIERSALLRERDSQLQAQQVLVSQWRQRHAEAAQRLDRQREELTKAELHLELIKDLMRLGQQP